MTRLNKGILIIACVAAFKAGAGDLEPEMDLDTVLMQRGDVVVTYEDWLAYLASVRKEIREGYDENLILTAQFMDSLWTWKVLAAEARAAGLDERRPVRAQMRWAAERALGKALLNEAEANAPVMDLEAQAREYWLLHPDDYTLPDQLHVSHILIAVNDNRSDEKALARAEEVHAMAESGERSFADLAREYSDDASAAAGGDLGPQDPARWVPPFRQAAMALEEPGEVSEPVKTRFGYHVIRLREKVPGEVVPYDQVREGLLEYFRKENAERHRQRKVEAARDMTGRELNVEALRRIMPLENLSPIQAFEQVRGQEQADDLEE